MMLPSRLGCPLSLKTPNMGNTGHCAASELCVGVAVVRMNSFRDRLARAVDANRSLLCVGLDPDPALMAIPDVAEFNRAIVDATKDLVCAYKPNMSFYEALGADGLRALEETIDHIRKSAPSAVVISDAKRGDIASSSAKYARALFDVWGFDAATVNPYAGGDSIAPFLEYGDRGVFVLCQGTGWRDAFTSRSNWVNVD